MPKTEFALVSCSLFFFLVQVLSWAYEALHASWPRRSSAAIALSVAGAATELQNEPGHCFSLCWPGTCCAYSVNLECASGGDVVTLIPSGSQRILQESLVRLTQPGTLSKPADTIRFRVPASYCSCDSESAEQHWKLKYFSLLLSNVSSDIY